MSEFHQNHFQVPKARQVIFLRERHHLGAQHRRAPQTFQPATGYELNSSSTFAEILQFASAAKQNFDQSGGKAREILYLLLRYPSAAIVFSLEEVEALKTISQENPPCRWEVCLNQLCFHSGGNRNLFVAEPGFVDQFEPHSLY
jgi:hypothetical protein